MKVKNQERWYWSYLNSGTRVYYESKINFRNTWGRTTSNIQFQKSVSYECSIISLIQECKATKKSKLVFKHIWHLKFRKNKNKKLNFRNIRAKLYRKNCRKCIAISCSITAQGSRNEISNLIFKQWEMMYWDSDKKSILSNNI